MAETTEITDARNIQVIELHMMDKNKYYPLALVSGACIRTCLYPLSLVKTRLQVQSKKTLYNGTWDAFKKIGKMEGIAGLYRGYWVNSLLTVPQMVYITVYEQSRLLLSENSVESKRVKSFVSGGCASIASQTFVVPLDIITQHMMMIGRQKDSATSQKGGPAASTSQLNPLKIGTSYQVMKAVYENHGVKGFYKGYFVSLLVYAPHSALWWYFYDHYSDLLASLVPGWVSRLSIQCVAGPLAGCTATLITNPLDVSRTRLQVTGKGTLYSTLANLWKYEGYRLFTKAITARMTQSTIFSFFIILGYETIKRWSLLDEHKSEVRW